MFETVDTKKFPPQEKIDTAYSKEEIRTAKAQERGFNFLFWLESKFNFIYFLDHKVNKITIKYLNEVKRRTEIWQKNGGLFNVGLPIIDNDLLKTCSSSGSALLPEYIKKGRAIAQKNSKSEIYKDFTCYTPNNEFSLSLLSHPKWCTFVGKTEMMFVLGTFYILYQNNKPKIIFYTQDGKTVDNIQHTMNNEIIPRKYVEKVQKYIEHLGLTIDKYEKITEESLENNLETGGHIGDLKRDKPAWEELKKILV